VTPPHPSNTLATCSQSAQVGTGAVSSLLSESTTSATHFRSGSAYIHGYSQVFAAAAKRRPGQGKYIRVRSRVSAGVVAVFTATCDNVVTPSQPQVAAGLRTAHTEQLAQVQRNADDRVTAFSEALSLARETAEACRTQLAEVRPP